MLQFLTLEEARELSSDLLKWGELNQVQHIQGILLVTRETYLALLGDSSIGVEDAPKVWMSIVSTQPTWFAGPTWDFMADGGVHCWVWEDSSDPKNAPIASLGINQKMNGFRPVWPLTISNVREAQASIIDSFAVLIHKT
jgi:hypothetical protein